MKIVITGGHHSSALPVIRKLREEYPNVQIYWFGHKYSALGDKNPTLEFHEITAQDIPFYQIRAGKFYRTLNLCRLLKIPFGLFQCLYLLVRIRPAAILSFGGYIAVPTVIAGYILGIPSITHEQTVVAGWANRVIAKFAKKVMISWQQSSSYFPKDRTVFVGLPLRKEIFEIRSNNFIFDNNLPVVYITTGKIGSHIINKTVGECLTDLLSLCNIIHQCSDNSVNKDFDMLTEVYNNWLKSHDSKEVSFGKYYLRKFVFEDEIGEAYAKSSMTVSRSGAHTTAELLALKKPCLLIPIPWVSHNEQYENAKILIDAGLGRILSEKDLSPQNLVQAVRTVLHSPIPVIRSPSNTNDISDPADLIVLQLMSVIKG